jgi:hypothetical protein
MTANNLPALRAEAHPARRQPTVLDSRNVYAPSGGWKRTAAKATTTALAITATTSLAVGVVSPGPSAVSTGLAYASGPLAGFLTWLVGELHRESRHLIYRESIHSP